MKDFNSAIITFIEDKDPINLDSFITSPSQVLNCEYLPLDHYLYTEAEIILDSLNAYNKELSNLDNEEDLTLISEESPLYSWRCATLAIKEFYSGNQFLVKEYLNEIRPESPVLKIRDFILVNKPNSLIKADSHLNSSVDAIKEVIDNSLVDMYGTTFKILLEDLKDTKQNKLDNILITIIEESLDNIPLNIIHKSILTTIDMNQSLRLMALGTVFKHPIISLQYWFSYVSVSNFKDTTDSKLTSLLLIITDICKALKLEKFKFSSLNSKKQFIKNSTLFIESMSDLLVDEYKMTKDPLLNLIRALKTPTVSTNIEKKVESVFQGELF